MHLQGREVCLTSTFVLGIVAFFRACVIDYFHIYSPPPPLSRLNLFIIIIKTIPTSISKAPHPNHTHIQTYKLDQFKMANTNDKESSVNQAPLATVDWQWHGIVRMIASMENLQTQEYVQQCAEREANGEAAISPTQKQLELMLAGLGTTNREHLLKALDAFESSKFLEELRAIDASRPECLQRHNRQ